MGLSQPLGGTTSRVQYIRMNRPIREAVRLLSGPDVDALVVIDGNRSEDGVILGIITERDIFRAMASGGLDVLDGLVWMLAKDDFISVDVSVSPENRLKKFCAHKADYVAIMDGFTLRAVQSIWDCIGDAPAKGVRPS